MHRTRTRLAARAHRVASAIERRGVVATYRLHDRVLANRRSRRLFAQRRPQLDDVQRAVLEGVATEGYAMIPFAELVPDGAARAAVEEQVDSFARRTEDALEREATGTSDPSLRRREGKEFVVRLWSYEAELGADDPWLRVCLSPRLLDVANEYMGMWSKLEYLDAWYSVPQAVDAERRASQRWHRDFNDGKLLKAFLYLVDVDDETGPFEYVPGSAGDGPYAGEWPWEPLGENYPPHEELTTRIPESVDQNVHRAARHRHLLRHERLPPRRLRDGQAPRARNGHLLLPRLAGLADRAELPLLRRPRGARRAAALRGHLAGRAVADNGLDRRHVAVPAELANDVLARPRAQGSGRRRGPRAVPRVPARTRRRRPGRRGGQFSPSTSP